MDGWWAIVAPFVCVCVPMKALALVTIKIRVRRLVSTNNHLIAFSVDYEDQNNTSFRLGSPGRQASRQCTYLMTCIISLLNIATQNWQKRSLCNFRKNRLGYGRFVILQGDLHSRRLYTLWYPVWWLLITDRITHWLETGACGWLSGYNFLLPPAFRKFPTLCCDTL